MSITDFDFSDEFTKAIEALRVQKQQVTAKLVQLRRTALRAEPPHAPAG